ncbi:MAG: acyl carrier protein [Candidatus Eremiobacteraeota bacterium]|nr:acyl carrier protein [Candidatus Eremiobacteraeota bacterium]NNM91770.1 acyl carrier protein [Candidatus Eremiobacteraeota bacterium]
MEASNSQRFVNLISEILRIPPKEVVDAAGMDDIGTWDSLSHMQLIITIESEYGIELSAEEIVGMRTVGKIRELLHSKGIEA